MSKSDRETIRLLDTKLDDKTAKTLMTCAIFMLVSVLMHDGDHIRQAYKWTYSIPLSLWALNLTVYVLPVVTIFLVKNRRFSACLVCAVAGVFTSASFLILHLCGSASGLWGVWNFSYFDIARGITYNGVYYQGIDWISWVFLFEVPVLSLPGSFVALKKHLAAQESRQGRGVKQICTGEPCSPVF
jgi:hypothetical protein